MKPLRNGMLTIAALALAGISFLALAPIALASNSWYVDGVSGSDSNTCMSSESACKTIGHAISLASSGDSIIVAAATYTENLYIRFNLNLIGSGANTTIIDGGRAGSVVAIPNYCLVRISGVTIRNGFAMFGGGIYNNARLTINTSTVTGNLGFTRNLGNSYGGGIYNGSNGVLTIDNSTLSANTAECGEMGCAGFGGGIFNVGEVLINNSTLSGNAAYAHFNYSQGGGIDNDLGIVTISNSTVSGNSAARGGGIFGGVALQNSIVANNLAGGNCSRTEGSRGYNLSSDNTCNFSGPGDLNNTNPKLGPLQNNGGPTQTMALLEGSPAIDAGNPAGCKDAQGNLLLTDQRGMPRPDKEDARGCDMGAYESQGD